MCWCIFKRRSFFFFNSRKLHFWSLHIAELVWFMYLICMFSALICILWQDSKSSSTVANFRTNGDNFVSRCLYFDMSKIYCLHVYILWFVVCTYTMYTLQFCLACQHNSKNSQNKSRSRITWRKKKLKIHNLNRVNGMQMWETYINFKLIENTSDT